MLEVIGIIAFFLIIMASIALHEVGHLVPAKLFGVKVTEYMVGFGPTLWSRKRGETTYGVKAIPLGGYIRMVGMLPPPKDAPEGTARSLTTGRVGTFVQQAREQALEEIAPGDENRVFYRLPVFKRVIIMLAGPSMNLLIAFVLFAGVLVGIGLPQPTTQVNSIVACAPSTTNPTGALGTDGQCPDGPTPAAQAGLQPGDVILRFAGVAVADWSELSALISSAAPGPVALTIQREGIEQSITVELIDITRPVVDEAGRDTGETATTGFLGVRPDFIYVSQPLSSVPAQMWDLTERSALALVGLPVRLYELVTNTLIGGQDRSLDSPVSVVGASRLGGDIVASEESGPAKIAIFLSLAASLNLFLFLFNLLPILPLDGGHVAGALYEGLRRRIARIRGRPDPGPVDVARMLPVAYAVAMVLIVVGGVVIFADLVRPLSLF
jgi:membrane-associated protease RseP (regulator of RpoE activity)